MKIQSINGYFSAQQNLKLKNSEQPISQPESINPNNNLLMDYTHNNVMVNFKSKFPPISPKYSLDEKLTSIFFNTFTNGDAVVVGRNFEQVVSGLKRDSKNFNTMLDRFLFVKDGGLAVPLAFVKMNEDFTSVYNLGDKNILIVRPNTTKTLEPGFSTIVFENDIIINNRRNIPISFQDNGIPYDQLKLIDKVFSFQTSRETAIEKFNQENVEKISSNENEKQLIKTEKISEPIKKGLSFSDVGGLDNVITQLKKGIVYPIKKPFAFKNHSINHGFLFYGPPGTGKTLLGKAIANEINAKFIELNGLELEDSLVGSTEKKWRELFEQAKQNQPCVLFIDEFDAVAKTRNGKDVYGDKVVNQILTLITDIDTNNDQVFIITATNMPERIDPAIIRKGRIGKLIEIPAPNEEGLAQIFDIHTKNMKLDENLDKNKLIKDFHSRNFTGADVRAITTDALDQAWERLGIYAKMEDDSLTPDEIEDVTIIQEDFSKAIKEFNSQKAKNQRNPIGFNKQ